MRPTVASLNACCCSFSRACNRWRRSFITSSAIWSAIVAAGVPGPEQLRACVELQAHGTERAVPALARLLADPALAHAARNALTAIPAPAAGRALREALAAGSSPDPIGLIQSLAARRDSAAVALLSQLAAAPASEPVALAAIDALGEMTRDDVVLILQMTETQTPRS